MEHDGTLDTGSNFDAIFNNDDSNSETGELSLVGQAINLLETGNPLLENPANSESTKNPLFNLDNLPMSQLQESSVDQGKMSEAIEYGLGSAIAAGAISSGATVLRVQDQRFNARMSITGRAMFATSLEQIPKANIEHDLMKRANKPYGKPVGKALAASALLGVAIGALNYNSPKDNVS